MHLAAPRCKVQMQRFASPALQANALAQAVAEQLRVALIQQSTASLAVSGGRSPIAFFQALCTQTLAWERVYVTLVDERCVPADHPDRNAQLVREHLLQQAAAQATLIDYLQGIEDPGALTASALVQQALGQLQALPWPLDVAVLGMGEDGHTASWFADSAGLEAALNSPAPLAWVQPAHAPHLRLSLTLNALRSCRHLHLAIAGEAKQAVFAAAHAGQTPDKPIQTLLTHVPSLQVWVAH